MNDSEGEVQIAGYDAFDTAHRMMALLAGLLSAVTIDAAKVKRHIDEAGITLAELADSLVRTEGISFRQAHDVASRLARRMVYSNPSIDFTSRYSSRPCAPYSRPLPERLYPPKGA